MMMSHRRLKIHTIFYFLVVVLIGVQVSSSSVDKLSQAVLDFEASRILPDSKLRAKEKEREVRYTLNLLNSAVVVASSSSSSFESLSHSSNNKANPAAGNLRLLSENSQYGEYSDYNNNNDESSGSGSQQQQEYDDDGYSSWNHNMVQQEFGFYITAYSFKYTGCHNVVDKENSYPEKMQRFVTFRLCPTQSCFEWKANGCSGGGSNHNNNNYGEYAVPLNYYLSALLEYNQGRVLSFCEYCQSCAMIESYKSFFYDMILRKQYTVQYAKAQFQTWLSSSSRKSKS
jgi:hypothetical protein